MRIGLAAVALMFLLSLCPASAAPSVLGYTGVLATPNTALVGEDAIDLSIHNIPDADFLMTGMEPSLTLFTGTFGASDNVEVTAALLSIDNGGSDDDFTFHLKYAILSEPEDEVGLAVGLIDIFEQLGSSVPVYLVLSKDLSGKVKNCGPVPVNIGLLFADDTPGILTGDDDIDEVQFFASATAELQEDITVVAEVLEEELNYGVRFNVGKDVNIDVGSFLDEFAWGVSYHTMW